MATDSPCTGVCEIQPRSGLCRGCLRTLAEIAGWSGFDEQKKRTIIAQLDRRAMPKD